MEFNFFHFMWIAISFAITLSGISILYNENLPKTFVRLYTFGKTHKTLQNKKSAVRWIEVPKRWFLHFYLFASIHLSIICIAIFSKYFANLSFDPVIHLLNFCSQNRIVSVKPESVVILSVLVTMHIWRRCYECLYISVYSDSKMNLIHYLLAFQYYFGVGLSLVHDAPGFQDFNSSRVDISGEWLTLPHCMGTIIFLLAFLLQFKTNKAFASMRKTGDKVTSSSHHMPSSGFFEYVSCPHYFAEIVMYLSGSLIFGGRSYTWWLVCLFTVTNQIISGLLNHQWYKKTFKHYPPHRKAIIPFLL